MVLTLITLSRALMIVLNFCTRAVKAVFSELRPWQIIVMVLIAMSWPVEIIADKDFPLWEKVLFGPWLITMVLIGWLFCIYSFRDLAKEIKLSAPLYFILKITLSIFGLGFLVGLYTTALQLPEYTQIIVTVCSTVALVWLIASIVVWKLPTVFRNK